MNIELKPRSIPFSVPALTSANDNAGRWQEGGSPRRQAIIYKPAKSATTSGRAGTKRWVLEFKPQLAPFIEPLMGWTGSTDPIAQVRLGFPTCEAAIAYAQRQDLDYEVRDAAKPGMTRAPVDQRQRQPVPWRVGLQSNQTNLLVTEICRTGFVPNIAA